MADMSEWKQREKAAGMKTYYKTYTYDEQKTWIDKQSFYSLLERWRRHLFGDLLFTGEIGKYYQKIMSEKRLEELDNGVSVSKAIGF